MKQFYNTPTPPKKQVKADPSLEALLDLLEKTAEEMIIALRMYRQAMNMNKKDGRDV